MLPEARKAGERWLRILPSRFLSFWQGQMLAVLCVLAAFMLRLALQPMLGNRGPFFTVFPALLVASIWGGPLAGLTVLIGSAVIVSAVWLVPERTAPVDVSAPAVMASYVLVSIMLLFIAILLRSLVSSHREAEARATLLAQEMRHRVRNLMGLVITISSQTARRAHSLPEYQEQFTARLHALAQAQDLAAEGTTLPTDLETLLCRLLHAFGHERCTVAGPAVTIDATAASALALVVHELCTNATKYGALSVPEGRVRITWARDGERVQIEWQEMGGPPVTAPENRGFGSRLIQSAFPPGMGEASLRFAPTGVYCLIRF